jgi:ADP-ribosylglycohydrolase
MILAFTHDCGYGLAVSCKEESMPSLSERGSGLIVGQALGDALGAPVEGMSADAIAAAVGAVDRMLDAGEIGQPVHYWRMPGLYTDDTQLALAIADTLVQTGAFSPDFFIKTCISLASADAELAFGAFRGTGGNFRATVSRWMEGVPWNRSGINTAGNGAAMRIAPIGLYYRDDAAWLIRAASESALCTHRHQTGVLAAVSLAQLVAYYSAKEPGQIQAAEVALELIRSVRAANNVLAVEYEPYLIAPVVAGDPWLEGLDLLPTLVDLEDREIAARIVAHARISAAYSLDGAGAAYAPASVLLAITMAIKYAKDPRTALMATIALGGDTDTTGAMVGAALGTLHGADAFPPEWRDELVDCDRLSYLGRMLGAAVQEISPDELPPDLVEAELMLTRKEARGWADRNREV